MKAIKFYHLILFLLVSIAINAQTILKNIPILTEEGDPVLIEMLAYDEEEDDSVWVNITENYWEYYNGWYSTGMINAKVPKGVEYKFRFLIGSKSLETYEYTYLTLKGAEKRTVIKSTEENPINFYADGPNKIFPLTDE